MSDERDAPGAAMGSLPRGIGPADWSIWGALPAVRLSQALLLSIGGEPDDWSENIQEVGQTLLARHRIALSHLRAGQLPLLERDNARPIESTVSLADFAAWAHGLGWKMPRQLSTATSERHGVRVHAGEEPRPQWLRSELWTLWEAAYLLSGREPRAESDFVSEDRDAGGPVAQAYRAMKDATIAGSLPFIEVDRTLMRRRVIPAGTVAWALQRGMQIPPRLVELAGQSSLAPAELGLAGSAPGDSDATDKRTGDAPNPLDTPTMAAVLDRIGSKDESAWRKTLGDPPKWMLPARVDRGVRGKVPATWNPVLLVLRLRERGSASERQARQLFQGRAELAPWAEEWRESVSRAEWYGLGE